MTGGSSGNGSGGGNNKPSKPSKPSGGGGGKGGSGGSSKPKPNTQQDQGYTPLGGTVDDILGQAGAGAGDDILETTKPSNRPDSGGGEGTFPDWGTTPMQPTEPAKDPSSRPSSSSSSSSGGGTSADSSDSGGTNDAPEQVTYADAAASIDVDASKRRRRRAGYGATILTGPAGIGDESTGKTLLGS